MHENKTEQPLDQSIEGMESDVITSELEAKLNEAESTIAELRDTHLREHAELENQRRRVQRDVEQARRFANERILRDLLPVCDNLERGLAVDHPEAAGIREGMELTLKALLKVMQDHGLVQVDPVGQAFDPELHEAMSMVAAEGQAPDTVVAVLEKGYVLNERLLRPARVVVAKSA